MTYDLNTGRYMRYGNDLEVLIMVWVVLNTINLLCERPRLLIRTIILFSLITDLPTCLL